MNKIFKRLKRTYNTLVYGYPRGAASLELMPGEPSDGLFISETSADASNTPRITNQMSNIRVHFEILKAANGRVIVVTASKYNPNGPNEVRSSMRIVPEDADLVDNLRVVLLTAGYL